MKMLTLIRHNVPVIDRKSTKEILNAHHPETE